MARRNEQFNFGESAYYSYSACAISDGTANEQTVGNAFGVYPNNGVSPVAWAEPEQVVTQGNDNHQWDLMSRMILMTGRHGGTGAWTGRLQYFRAPAGSTFDLLIDIDFPDLTVGALNMTVIDGPFPADFLRSSPSPLMDDTIQMAFSVTPGSATAQNVTAVVLIVPGFVDGASNKGAILSAPQFLTYRSRG